MGAEYALLWGEYCAGSEGAGSLLDRHVRPCAPTRMKVGFVVDAEFLGFEGCPEPHRNLLVGGARARIEQHWIVDFLWQPLGQRP